MNVEFTGRQYEVTPVVRRQVEHGLLKLQKILGNTFDTHVILTLEKKRHIAEITVTVRNNSFVGVAEAAEMSRAIGEAMNKIDRQAVRYKTKFRAKKRIARKVRATTRWNGHSTPEADGAKSAKTGIDAKIAVGTSESTAVDVVVHAFPRQVHLREHVVKSDDSIAMRPMTVEEAVKEAEFRDRDVLVFRDMKGRVNVLHRRRDGKMELIEVP